MAATQASPDLAAPSPPPSSPQDLALCLEPADLKRARLACKAWTTSLAAGVRKVCLWPDALRRPAARRLRSSSKAGGASSFCPALLLSGLGSDAEVTIRLSWQRLPKEQQLQQLAEQLAACAPCSVRFVCSFDPVPRGQNPHPIVRCIFQQLSKHPRLAQRLRSLAFVTDLCWALPSCWAPALLACTNLRTLDVRGPRRGVSYSQLQLLGASLTQLQRLTLLIDPSIYYDPGSSEEAPAMQLALQQLVPLSQLQELSTNFVPSSCSRPVRIPEWPHLTLLRQAEEDAEGAGPCTKQLGPLLCSRLRSLELAPLQAAAPCPRLTRLVLLPRQPLAQLPACAELRRLELQGEVPLEGLAQLLGQLPELQVRRRGGRLEGAGPSRLPGKGQRCPV